MVDYHWVEHSDKLTVSKLTFESWVFKNFHMLNSLGLDFSTIKALFLASPVRYIPIVIIRYLRRHPF